MNALKLTTNGLRCPFVVLEKEGRHVEVRGVTHFADSFFFDRVYFLKPSQVIQHEAVVFRQTHNPLYIVMMLYVSLLKLGLTCQGQFIVQVKKQICDDFENLQKVELAFDGNTNTKSYKGTVRQIKERTLIPSTRIEFCQMIFDSLICIKKLHNYRRLIESRDETAALCADCASDSDIVLIWGAAHVKGIVKNLKNLGWKKLSTRWVTAVAL